jgi:hypothetical protein
MDHNLFSHPVQPESVSAPQDDLKHEKNTEPVQNPVFSDRHSH